MQLDSRTLPRRARATRSVIALLSFLSGFSAGLLGQTPEQRREIDAFRDTLQSVTDTLALREREKRLLPFVRRARSDPAFHLSLGYLALRQGELGGASHLDEAASEFRLAASLAPQWPYAWLAVAYAEYTLGGRLGGSDRRAMLARDAFSRATQAFARAVTLEPGFASRLEELARRAVRDGSLNKAGVIREALRRATSAPLRGARVLLALGRVQRELGDTAALGTLAAYLATHDNRALGLVELGRTQLLRGDWSGAAAYLAGAVDDDPVAGAEYRADLASIASDSDLAEFDRRRGPARAEFLRRFWTVRDRLELRREGERLAEHLRRLAVARREFLVVMPDSTERFDDRGRIYVRHGDPDDRASYVVPGIEPNESWRYRRGGAARADLVLHFVARQAPNDYRLVESVVDVSNARGIPAAGKSRNAAPASEGLRLAETTEQLFRSRSALAPRYRQMPPSRPDQLADFLTWERALGRRGIRVAASSDSYVLHFARDLDAWGALLVAGGSGARPMIQVVFAIPGYRIEPATGAAGVVYPVRVRFAALDSLGNLVASVDSTAWIELGEPLPANRSLVGRIAVPVRPGHLVAHAALQYGDQAGSDLGIDTILVPAPGGGELALGDLLVGSDRGRIPVPVGGGPEFSLAPGGVVYRSENLELAVEIFGMEPGAQVSLRVLIAPRETDRPADEPGIRWRPFPHRRAVAVQSRGPGAGPIVPWRVTLPLKGLAPGAWSVAVLATDRTGRVVRQEAPLELKVP